MCAVGDCIAGVEGVEGREVEWGVEGRYSRSTNGCRKFEKTYIDIAGGMTHPLLHNDVIPLLPGGGNMRCGTPSWESNLWPPELEHLVVSGGSIVE